MASIRMSNQLREQMYAEARSNFEITNKTPVFDNETTITIESIIRNSKMQLNLKEVYDKTHSSGLSTVNSFGLDSSSKYRMINIKEYDEIWLQGEVLETNGNGPTTGKTTTHKVAITLPLKRPFYVCETGSYYDNNSQTCNLQDMEQEEVDMLQPLLQNHYERLTAYQNKRTEYERQIKELLWKASTLKKVLDVWPAAEQLVPHEIIQRMHEKITRATSAKRLQEDISFDTQLVNNVALKAKLQKGA